MAGQSSDSASSRFAEAAAAAVPARAKYPPPKAMKAMIDEAGGAPDADALVHELWPVLEKFDELVAANPAANKAELAKSAAESVAQAAALASKAAAKRSSKDLAAAAAKKPKPADSAAPLSQDADRNRKAPVPAKSSSAPPPSKSHVPSLPPTKQHVPSMPPTKQQNAKIGLARGGTKK
jgi:hypothetical protein